MPTITQHDREILRALAAHQQELAHSPENDRILQKWNDLAAGKRGTPTMRFLVSNFVNETIWPRMRCEAPDARRLEQRLLTISAGRDLFGDDTPIPAQFCVQLPIWAAPFGNTPNRIRAEGENAKGYHIEPTCTRNPPYQGKA